MGGNRRDARTVALGALVRIEQENARIDDALAHAGWATLSSVDRALSRALVAGVVRFSARLNAEIATFTEHGLPKDGYTGHALRLAAFQVSRLDRIPSYAAINAAVESVKEVRGCKVAGFVNAVLRRYATEWGSFMPRDRETRHSMPNWIIDEIERAVGPGELDAACDALNREAPLVLRRNPRVDWPRDLPEGASGDPTLLPGWREGAFYVQDTASQRVVELVPSVDAAARILDICAAPGGKTFGLAERGRVVAVDRSHGRLIDLADAKTRLLVRNVTLVRADGRRLPLRGPFAVVLVDAPCSSLGTMRRHPEVRWRTTADEALRYSVVQYDLLEAGAALVAPGGWLIYSVCTFTRAETDDVVGEFVEGNPAFSRTGGFSLWPHRDNADAHFAAVFTKAG